MKVRDVIKMIEQDGWYLARTTGSHRHYYHPAKPGTVTVPGQAGKDLPEGTKEQCVEAGGIQMTEALRYAVVFERSADGYGAFVPDLPGCITVGDTLAEADTNIREAISGHIAAIKEHGESIPRPSTLAEYVEVSVAVGQ